MPIGIASEVGRTEGGRAVWSVRIHGADVPGRGHHGPAVRGGRGRDKFETGRTQLRRPIADARKSGRGLDGGRPVVCPSLADGITPAAPSPRSMVLSWQAGHISHYQRVQ